MATTAMNIATSVESQALNTVIGGFSFAAALSWYEVVKKVVERVVKSNGSTQGAFIAALLTTLLAIIVYMVLKTFITNVEIKEPGQASFVVTR